MAESWWLLGLIGLVAGVLSGLLGVGGGLIIVPLLVMVTKMDIHHAIGTSLAIIVPTAACGALRHHWAGHIHWKYVLVIALVAMVGSFFGAHVTTWLSSRVLRGIFAIFLVAVAFRMLVTN